MIDICNYNTICTLGTNLTELCFWIVEILLLHSFYKRIHEETPDRYLSLYEIRGTNVVPYYFQYIGFRIVPMFLVCLLNYKILLNFSEEGSMNVFIFNLILVLTELLLTNLSAVKKYWGHNLAYGHLLVSILLATIPLVVEYSYKSIFKLLPSTQGIIDNVWSALIIFSLYSVIMFLSKKNNAGTYPEKEQLLEVIFEYNNFIEEQCSIYNADVNLVKSVAIYESIQRPGLLRLMERVFVFVFRVPVSQGVMQFTTNYVISDRESITLTIEKYFQNTANNLKDYNQFRAILWAFNQSERYASEVNAIHWKITNKGFE